MGTKIIIYSPPDDWSQTSDNPFDSTDDMITEEKEYYEQVEREMKRLKPT